jgi:hypothetical protein
MTFVAGETYISREGKEYIYIERRQGVQIFECAETKTRLLLNLVGRYRWDDQDHPCDIIGNK